MKTDGSKTRQRPMLEMVRPLGWIAVASMLVLALVGPGVGSAGATQPDPEHKVTICHRTDSETNPYVQIDVDSASVDGDAANDNGKGDHLIQHTGPVWHEGIPKEPKWGDIIPPFYSDGTPDGLPSLNWDAAGQAIFANDCNIPGETTTTTTTTTATTTETTTETTSETTTSTETTTTGTGGVEAETSKPHATPPSTSTVLGQDGSSNQALPLILMGMAIVTALSLLISPRVGTAKR